MIFEKYDQEQPNNYANLERAYQQLQQNYNKSNNALNSLQEIHNDLINDYERQKQKTIKDLTDKIKYSQNQRKKIEIEYNNRIQTLKAQVDQKDRELQQHFRNQVNVDQDILKLQILNEVEEPHQKAIEQKEIEIQTLQNKLFKIKREKELQIGKIQGQILDLQNNKEYQFKNMYQKIDELQNKLQIHKQNSLFDEQQTDQRSLKNQIEELTYSLNHNQQEMENVQKQLIEAKEQLVQTKIKYEGQIDKECQKHQNFKIECERIHYKLEFMESQIKDYDYQIQTKNKKLEQLDKDINNQIYESNNKESIVVDLKRQFQDLKKESISKHSQNEIQLNKNLEDLRKQCSKYKQDKEQIYKNNQQLQNKIEEHQQIIQSLQQNDNISQTQNISNQNRNLQQKIEMIEQQIENIKNGKGQSKQELQVKYDKIKQTLEKANQKIFSQMYQNLSLRKQLNDQQTIKPNVDDQSLIDKIKQFFD